MTNIFNIFGVDLEFDVVITSVIFHKKIKQNGTNIFITISEIDRDLFLIPN